MNVKNELVSLKAIVERVELVGNSMLLATQLMDFIERNCKIPKRNENFIYAEWDIFADS